MYGQQPTRRPETNPIKPKVKPLKVNKHKLPRDSKFAVIVDPPFVAHVLKPDEPRFPRDSDRYYEHLVYWIRAMFDGRHVVASVFGISKHADKVIVQLDSDVDLEPYLGMHYWREVLADPPVTLEATRNTKIFEYNYEKFGHPAQTQHWLQYFPDTSNDKGMPVVRRPYPRGHYAIPPGGGDSICSALPPYRGSTPPPLSPPSESPQKPVVKAEPEEAKLYVGKVDPYEEEDNAHLLLRSNAPVKEEPSESKFHVKSESTDPDLGNIQEMKELFQQRQAAKRQMQLTQGVKQESEPAYLFPPSSSAVKSEDEALNGLAQALKNKQYSVPARTVKQEQGNSALDEMNELFRQRQALKYQMKLASSVKQESDSTNRLPPASSASTAEGPEVKRLKREITEFHLPEEGSILQGKLAAPYFDQSTGRRVKADD